MNSMHSVIKKPLLTEKGTDQKEAMNKYLFEVDRKANAIQVRNAIEKIFNVKVTKVNIINVRGKGKRVGKSFGMTSDWKKAIVTLKADQKIEIIEGV